MPYIVYITDSCQEEARKHSFDQELKQLKTRIEKSQNISFLDRFSSSSYFAKKKFGSFQGRLITHVEEHSVTDKDFTIVIFLTIYKRQ